MRGSSPIEKTRYGVGRIKLPPSRYYRPPAGLNFFAPGSWRVPPRNKLPAKRFLLRRETRVIRNFRLNGRVAIVWKTQTTK